MAEPQNAPATEAMDEAAPPPAASAEDRKTQAAMSALESSRGVDNEDSQKPSNKVDANAISEAISRLEIANQAGKSSAEDPNEARRKKREEEQKERERRAKIKVNQADVTTLVEECDLTKTRATELLRAHEGDFEQALRAFLRQWT